MREVHGLLDIQRCSMRGLGRKPVKQWKAADVNLSHIIQIDREATVHFLYFLNFSNPYSYWGTVLAMYGHLPLTPRNRGGGDTIFRQSGAGLVFYFAKSLR